jgi:transcriptional regulator with XRE-family HTH domain
VAGVAEGQLQRIVGLNLARVRHARGLTQEELAEELAFHRTYLGALERGERNLSLRGVERLASKLGVQPLDLLKAAPQRRRSR